MFDSLSERLDKVFRKIKGRGRLDENTIDEALREVRLALLEADVNYKVVKDFISRVKEKSLGQQVLKSLTPGQQVVKIVHEELIELLGGENIGLNLQGKKPYVFMLVGLQGSGKTTSAAKLALFLRRTKKLSPYLVPADVYRPAAIEQLQKLGSEINVPVFASTVEMKPVEIVNQAIEEAKEKNCDLVILDTAGRLHIDEPLMNELAELKKACTPQEILFVADAMTGQDAVNVAAKFDELLDITGVILTKMDGDARGGAALSIKSVTGKPIKLIGVGEKLKDLEIFYPDRIASRILGMGDILTLIEKAKESIDDEEAVKLEEKIKTAKFDLEDFRTQMRRIRKLGSIEGLLKLIPGMGRLRDQLKNVKIPEKQMVKIEAIINSMTKEERKNPKIINASRKERIAKGSGTTVQDVNNLLTNFEQMRKMMQQMMGQMGGRHVGPKAGKKVDRKKLKQKRKKLKKKKKK